MGGGQAGNGLYISTTGLSGALFILAGMNVSKSLTFSQAQYWIGSQPGGPWGGWTSSQIKAIGLGNPASRWSWVALSTQGSWLTSFRLKEKTLHHKLYLCICIWFFSHGIVLGYLVESSYNIIWSSDPPWQSRDADRVKMENLDGPTNQLYKHL